MNLFQALALSVLAGVLLAECYRLWRGAAQRGARVFRCLIWLLAVITIARPDLVQRVAITLGIGRGADIILYLFTLAFLTVSFYFYSRYVRLQRQLSKVVRHVAIREACRGRNEPAQAGEEEVPLGPFENHQS